MTRLMNDQAVSWAAMQTTLGLHDRLVLQLVAQLLQHHEQVVITTPVVIAAVYELPFDLVDDCITHLCQSAYLTPASIDRQRAYRVNYTQTNADRRARSTAAARRPIPLSLTEQETTAA